MSELPPESGLPDLRTTPSANLSGRVYRAVPPDQTDKLPSGSDWLHKIKHDGFRVSLAARTARSEAAPQVIVGLMEEYRPCRPWAPNRLVAEYPVDHVFVYRCDQNLPYKISDA